MREGGIWSIDRGVGLRTVNCPSGVIGGNGEHIGIQTMIL